MAIDIEYFGWVTFRLTSQEGTRLVTDPSLAGDRLHKIPPSPATIKDLSDCHIVLVTHAAADHFAQAVELMKASRATLFLPQRRGHQGIEAGNRGRTHLFHGSWRPFSISGYRHQSPSGLAYFHV